jgi:phage host-nuclease inhibitor protein Gam
MAEISEFRELSQRKDQIAARQQTQFTNRISALTQENENLQKRLAESEITHQDQVLVERTQRQSAEKRVESELKVRTELLRSIGGQPFDDEFLQTELRDSAGELYEKWQEVVVSLHGAK